MSDGPLGCQSHAGITEGPANGETLTQRAKDLFIQEVKQELTLGTDGFTPTFPCGPKIQPNKYADQLQLEDETQFPDFHQNIIRGQYEKIARELNLKGGFAFLPICDIFALAFALNIDFDAKIDFFDGFLDYMIPNLPKLAVDLDIKPPKLALKFPALLTLPPEIPDFSIPQIPNIQLSTYNLDLDFAIKLKNIALSLALKMPQLVLDFPNIFKVTCETVFDAKLFDIPPDALVKVVAYKVLTRKISEMMLILATAKTMGSSPNGLVGGMGKKLGYDPPVQNKKAKPRNVRDKIVKYATDCVDLEWGNTRAHKSGDGTTQEVYVQSLLYTEYGDGKPKDKDKTDPTYDARVIGRDRTIVKASNASSCGMFVRACLYAAGASYVFKYRGQPLLNKNEKTGRYYDFFQDEYRVLSGGGIAIEGLIQAAKAKDAFVEKQKNDLPALKRGDVIIVYDPNHAGREHVMVLAEDYQPGSRRISTIEGGQPDPHNHGRPTAIRKKTYADPTSSDFKNKTKKIDPPYGFVVDVTGKVLFSGREILRMIDAEKLCTSKIGRSTAAPDSTLDPDFFDRNDPSADEEKGLLPAEG